jgi:hypothetical protein
MKRSDSFMQVVTAKQKEMDKLRKYQESLTDILELTQSLDV